MQNIFLEREKGIFFRMAGFFGRNVFLILSTVITVIVLCYLLIPFFIYNRLVSWDFAGLYFSAWYQKEFLFPGIFGWNPYFFLGYAQNQFYPPLFSYLTGGLAYILPIESAFKVVFAVSLILLPFSFYYFARSFELSRNKSGIIMLLMFGILFLFPEQLYGGNMHATFHIGLITHTLGIALFFFYWGQLNKNFGSGKFIFLSIIFSAIILTHIIAAFAASFLLIAYLLSKIRGKREFTYAVLHIILVFLLTAFWTIPFISKSAWMDAYPIGLISYTYLFLFGAFFYILYLWMYGSERFYPVGLFVLILIAFSALSQAFLDFPVHLYRFMMYFYLLIPLSLLSLRQKVNCIFLSLFLLAGLFMIIFSYPVDTKGPDYGLLPFKAEIPGNERLFILAPFSKQPSPHLLQNVIPMKLKVYGLRGLYVESAKNARYISNLENSLAVGDSPIWGIYANWDLISNNTSILEAILPYQLNILNIRYVVSWKNYSHDWKSIGDIANVVGLGKNDINLTYRIYDPGRKNGLIEILNYTPRVIAEDWDFRTARWFLSEEIMGGILVDSQVPSFRGKGNEKITLIEESRRQDYIHFHVDSKEPVPILIKISAFPNWKAYSNGMPVKIYKASPYIMLIYGYGDIELKYGNLSADNLGVVLSLIGAVLLAGMILYLRNSKL